MCCLTTPLVRALRQGIPGARVDMLVFRGTEGMLAGNPDIDRVITISQQPSMPEMARWSAGFGAATISRFRRKPATGRPC